MVFHLAAACLKTGGNRHTSFPEPVSTGQAWRTTDFERIRAIHQRVALCSSSCSPISIGRRLIMYRRRASDHYHRSAFFPPIRDHPSSRALYCSPSPSRQRSARLRCCRVTSWNSDEFTRHIGTVLPVPPRVGQQTLAISRSTPRELRRRDPTMAATALRRRRSRSLTARTKATGPCHRASSNRTAQLRTTARVPGSSTH
jgi:hypothetical protein